MANPTSEVLAANRAFYKAFDNGDTDTMDELWARGVPVACIHPGWNALRGREAVMASWRSILLSSSSPAVSCTGATAHVLGDTAFVVCREEVDGAQLIATNVFVRENGRWKLVHHHAAPLAESDEDEEVEVEETPDRKLVN